MNRKNSIEKISLTIPSKEEYISIVRLLISGFASKLNFDFDEIEEIKIAVSEVCLNSIQYAYAKTSKLGSHPSITNEIQIDCYIKNNDLEISIKDHGKGFKVKKDEDQIGFGFSFLKEYMDKVELYSEEGKGTEVKIIKHPHHISF
jgi:serine/threonine-protein kinase RsbW